jgi:hypothetical protein
MSEMNETAVRILLISKLEELQDLIGSRMNQKAADNSKFLLELSAAFVIILLRDGD